MALQILDNQPIKNPPEKVEASVKAPRVRDHDSAGHTDDRLDDDFDFEPVYVRVGSSSGSPNGLEAPPDR